MAEAELTRILAAASAARRSGRPDEAAKLYRGVIAEVGDHPLALNALGMMALGEGRPSEATGYFSRAIKADGNSPDLWMNLATAARSSKDVAAERAALEGALSIDQAHFMALVRMAELLERIGEEEQAAERWQGVLTLAAMIEERSPALEAMLDHARDSVAREGARFAASIDQGLASSLEDLGPGRRRAQACIDHALGRRAIYANHCTGLHFPFLPADEFFARSHFPWLAQIEAQTSVIREELLALLDAGGAGGAGGAGFRPYVSMKPGTSENKWTVLDNSLNWGALHLWEDGRRNEDACARAPRTAAAVEALPLCDLPGKTPTVFFSLLRPGTHLPAHTGVSNVRTVVHLPLIVPDGCALRVGGEKREWRVGEAFAFDDTIEHEAWNLSDELRAVLIFDVWNPHITDAERGLLRRFYEVAERTGDGERTALRVRD